MTAEEPDHLANIVVHLTRVAQALRPVVDRLKETYGIDALDGLDRAIGQLDLAILSAKLPRANSSPTLFPRPWEVALAAVAERAKTLSTEVHDDPEEV